MNFVDTHSHLYLPEFDQDRDAVIERARRAGVTRILLPNIDSFSISPMLDLYQKFPKMCYPMIGLHPTSVDEIYRAQLEKMEAYLDQKIFVAIGEVGMDLYWDKTFIAEQKEVLSYQIDLARKHSLPLVIHSRESHVEIVEVLRNKKNQEHYSGVFHSFSGDLEQACEVISLGFKIGINGIVTFKNSNLASVVKEVSLNNIVIETDAPYLTPVPFRGKRNESAYVVHVAQKISEIKQIPLEEVARVTTQNAENLFKLT